MQLHQPQVLAEFAKLNAGVIVISFAALPRLAEWAPYFRANFLEPYYKLHGAGRTEKDPLSRTCFLADPSRSTYHAYGLGRHSVGAVYSAKILWQYARWVVEGKPIKKSFEDTLQRGGDFVVGRDGRLTLSYVGQDQSDRPSVVDILAALRQ